MADAGMEVRLRVARCSSLVALALALVSVPSAHARPCGGACEPQRLQYPPPKGLPMLITGGALFVVGIPTLFVGTTLVLSTQEQPGPLPYGGLAFAIPGAAMVLLGIPLAAVGAVRFERFLRRSRSWSVAPTAGRGAGGAPTAGVTIRF